jgi:hypothetical protein
MSMVQDCRSSGTVVPVAIPIVEEVMTAEVHCSTMLSADYVAAWLSWPLRALQRGLDVSTASEQVVDRTANSVRQQVGNRPKIDDSICTSIGSPHMPSVIAWCL